MMRKRYGRMTAMQALFESGEKPCWEQPVVKPAVVEPAAYWCGCRQEFISAEKLQETVELINKAV